ncbi:TOG array regulator of axonemal microtubules protein 1 isoform X4 [Polyergus mexicanus]|uniref:TOG array regulator of axonemal microtubules protein 1 isoform X4 n=1 Tax=Polyergus mexicanus TaxID=615972 RepID=UPI0038B43153
MSGCLSSSMTGSTDAGPLQPQEDPAPPSTYDLRPLSENNGSSARRGNRHRHQPRRRMTSAPSSGQTIQLTPLWEHVVRTRRFPSEVDTQATFVEISERLRDPEWEVRQHALRVLMDVLPTLNADAIDKVMQPVVPELINNLGHPAPAVRKGALDALRVYLVHTPNRDSVVKNILHDGLNRPDAHNPFQTNVTTGVILSAPLLLFPSSDSPPPTMQILKDATIAFAARLVQIPHQEAALKSLMKIRNEVGDEEFESYLADYDDKLKKNIDVLSKIYNIKPSKKKRERNHAQDIVKANIKEQRILNKSWDSDSDTSGIAEEEDEASNAIPPARVVLETEIKFNEETAITMTILEEKGENESEDDGTGKGENSSSPNKRKTPRRVRFGGEIVKLRTPDSDETESIEITPKTRIPLPVSPATKMPETTSRRRPSSQPCSPHAGEKRRWRRVSRSASNSPKREYTHNAQLSPKKSILTRTDGPLIVVDPVTEEIKKVKKDKRNGEAVSEDKDFFKVNDNLKEVNVTSRKEDNTLDQTTLCAANKEEKLMKNNENNRAKDENNISKIAQVAIAAAPKNVSSKGEQAILQDNHTGVIDESVSETISRREKNSSPTKLLNSSGPKAVKENKDDNLKMEKERSNEDVWKTLESNFVSDFSNDLPFGSPVNDEYEARIDRLVESDFVDEDEREDVRICGSITDNRATKNDDGEGRRRRGQCFDRKSTSEGNGSVTCSSSEGEGKPREPSWEELGLVGQEVLDDLHNKDDWRARVRGLERVASALRTSSALIAIESRLGSLLHAVLGGERSCRVAAAGFAVAKIVVAGVSEDALRKRLPQLAWGLARQGGPAAAQLTRIAMLRLKPSLLLEQFLQSHCLSARNAKTRENALQLLIFSLVTFPSTEFKLETVANRVAAMVADRRRRVRQAALDALAVLGQIYDSEKVLEAGRRAADGHADAEAMLAAVRARLARKSLPLVSADGLVVYGLQISSTVQIATGPDVDWIVAGSGSVSPGTGRTRGQIIATSRSAQGRASRNESTNNRESSWMERPNLVALGVGLQSKTEQSTAWQILPSQTNNDNENHIKGSNGRNINAGVFSNVNLRLEEQLRSSYIPLNQYDFVETDAKNHREISDNNFEQKARNRKNVNEVAKEKESTTLRGESKIPILLSTRERYKITSQNREKSINLEHVNSNSRKQTKDALDSNSNRIDSRQENIRSYAAVYQRRKRLQQEASQTSNQTFDSHCSGYRSSSYVKASGTTNREYNSVAGNREAIFSNDNSHNYGRFVNDDSTDKNENSDRTGGRKQLSRNMQQQTLVEMYSSVHERQRKLMDRTTYRRLRTAPNPLTCVYHESEHLESQVSPDKDRNMIYRSNGSRTKDAVEQDTEMDLVSSDSQENEYSPVENANPHRRRLRSLSPSQLHQSRQFIKLASSRFHTASMYDIDKAVNEEEYNARNKRHLSPDANNYHVQNSNKEESRYQEFLRSFSVGEHINDHPKSASSSSSDASGSNRGRIDENQDAVALRDYNGNSNNSRSSTPESQDDDPAFDVITTNRQSVCDDVDSSFTRLDTNKVEYPIEMANVPDDASKEWNSKDDAKPTNRIGSISRHSIHGELITINENRSGSAESSCSMQPEDVRSSARRKSIVSVISNERILPYEDPTIIKESLQSKALSPKKSDSLYLSPENRSINNSPISDSPAKRSSRCGSRNLAENSRDSSEERIIASIVPDEDASIQSLDTIARPPIDISMIDDSPAIIIASRPHSHETAENIENSRNKIHTQESTEEESSVNETLEDKQSKDSTSETNTEPGILKIESESVEAIVPIRGTGRYRAPSNKRASPIEKPSEKSKRMVQQCLVQLENKDWEITMKGLKSLSQISKQHPECLDTCPVGTIGRLLGRHIKNLRSQVARAACLAASDVFSSQIRGIDQSIFSQDLDDIAGPLLQRTADTNRFLRADSNAALDQMVQHLPPHKTIGIILRGASHQNAIVRAATARLLSDITDRIGPDHIMILPRDVKNKLLNTGAKLLMDGNLDARNYAKKMFRCLTRCEGFRKALTDAVPETTLRHIDKTMKTL